jgi:hypothetical protein
LHEKSEFVVKKIVQFCYPINKIKKTLMNTKNLMSRSVKHVNRSTIDDLAIDLVELSERDLQHISGGFRHGGGCNCGRGGGGTTTTTTTTTSNGTSTTTTTTTSNGTSTTTTTTTSNGATTAACNCQLVHSSGELWATVPEFDSIFGESFILPYNFESP